MYERAPKFISGAQIYEEKHARKMKLAQACEICKKIVPFSWQFCQLDIKVAEVVIKMFGTKSYFETKAASEELQNYFTDHGCITDFFLIVIPLQLHVYSLVNKNENTGPRT